MDYKIGDHENEIHDEMLQAVTAGYAAVLSDETLPGGRFQVAAMVTGGEFVLTSWHLDAAGWHSCATMFLKKDAATQLVALLHSSGYAKPPTAVP